MSIITFPEYTSKKAVYGFIGKKSQEHGGKYTEKLKNPQELLGLEGAKLSLLKQVHGNKCVYISKDSEEAFEADAQITREPNVILAIQTADCVPIIFIDEKHKVIGAAHAGWRGALNGIIPNTIKAMYDLGSTVKELMAIVGPSIRQSSYEVGEEFFNNFQKESTTNQIFFQESIKPNRYLFDLPGYVKGKLKATGIQNVLDIMMDTYKDEENFHSYRRSMLRGEPLNGRILSVVCLR